MLKFNIRYEQDSSINGDTSITCKTKVAMWNATGGKS